MTKNHSCLASILSISLIVVVITLVGWYLLSVHPARVEQRKDVVWRTTIQSSFEERNDLSFYSVEFHPDGRSILVGTEEGIYSIDTDTGDILHQVGENVPYLVAGIGSEGPTFNLDGSRIAIPTSSGATILSTADNVVNEVMLTTNDGAFSVDFNPLAEEVVVASRRQTVHLFDDRMQEVWHTNGTDCVATWGCWQMASFSNTGDVIAVGGADGKLKLIGAETGQIIWDIQAHDALLTDFVFSADDTMLLTAGYDSNIRLWSVSDATLIKEYSPMGWTVGVDIAQNAAFFISVNWSDSSSLGVVDLETSILIEEFSLYSVERYDVDLSPNGDYVVVGGIDELVMYSLEE